MKKQSFWITAIFGLLALSIITLVSSYKEAGKVNVTNFDLNKNVGEKTSNILIIAGEGGPSGYMFYKSAETYQRQNGGEIFEVHGGDEFISVVKNFVAKTGEIDHLEYFGHGNDRGLYVNQEINKNGSLYANDPVLNQEYAAASIYELNDDIFSSIGWIKINGCNVAKNYETADTLAERIADYFNIDVVAPIGPTEFSRSSFVVDPIPQSNYLDPNFSSDVYMVSTYFDQGFVTIKPRETGESGFVDIKKGDKFDAAVNWLVKAGLDLGFEDRKYHPYQIITYKEAKEFCAIFAKDDLKCFVAGYKDDNKIRNLHALKMLVDAYEAKIEQTNPWNRAYISFGNENKLLTEDFINKKWYTRAEMAELTWNFIKFKDSKF